MIGNKKMKKIKAVGFDYGGVIGGGPQAGISFTDEVSTVLGLDCDTYRNAYFEVNYLINTGKVATWREFWPILLAKLNLPVHHLKPLLDINYKYSKVYLEMDKRMIDLVDRLRLGGYKVGLLSNATKEYGQHMRSVGLNKHFDAFLISSEIQLQKPHKDAYISLAKELGVNIKELAFIDDATKSLSTASTVGYTPILFKSYDGLINELTKLKILKI